MRVEQDEWYGERETFAVWESENGWGDNSPSWTKGDPRVTASFVLLLVVAVVLLLALVGS